MVIVNGPRQAGKTTLLRQYERDHGADFRTLDTVATREFAEADPEAFVRTADRTVIIDEVQLGGDRLIRAIKQVVDGSQRPGQFVLSGSTRFLTTPGISESLAGRAVFTELWPMSLAELTETTESSLLPRAFADPRSMIEHTSSDWTRDGYIDAACAGGFPEALRLPDTRVRQRWFAGYVQTIISRDAGVFASAQETRLITRLLSLVAARSGGLLVFSDLAKSLAITNQTVQTYLDHLDTVFLTSTIPTWSTNATSRITKAPKVFLTDTGLLAQLRRVGRETLLTPGAPGLGSLIESFVFTELMKSRAVDEDFDLFHFRDRDGREIDFVCEGADGRVVAIEVKASTSPRSDAGRHLRWLRSKIKDRFAAGIVLYLGQFAGSLGDDIYLLPISALWGHQPLQSSQ
ncbi:ATP-binding protein [Microlunatus speluncae]|uniref:ATP-binding protein n=1 Tax=Microlunatus speluncae TaxID=2594267 RepID=UPI001C2D2503|nr:ATP-binding protein [Microlunatus speluncae]